MISLSRFLFFRKSPEEILENHVVDLKQQLSQRDEFIDKLQGDVRRLTSEHLASLDQVLFTFNA